MRAIISSADIVSAFKLHSSLYQNAVRLSYYTASLGWPAGLEHTKEDGTSMLVSDLVTLLEKGNPLQHIPPRPFIRVSLSKIVPIALGTLKTLKFLEGAYSTYSYLAIEMYKILTDELSGLGNAYAPNAPSTVAKKGTSIPLLDSGKLRADIKISLSTRGV